MRAGRLAAFGLGDLGREVLDRVHATDQQDPGVFLDLDVETDLVWRRMR